MLVDDADMEMEMAKDPFLEAVREAISKYDKLRGSTE